MMPPAFCGAPSSKINRAPTAPISGALRMVSSAERSAPGINCESLFNRSRYTRRLVHSGEEMDVFLVADDVHAHQTIQQKRRLVRRGVVDDDHLQGVFRDRSQTRQCQLRAIEQYKEDGDLR